jgi:Rps23 Pro-64 3,4-dihydroxylase Tpa1-like proline 4-hydroxylase
VPLPVQKIEVYDFAHLSVRKTPFPHGIISPFLKPDLGLAVLNWFESKARWRLVETDFYEQYEFDIGDVTIPIELDFLKDLTLLRRLRFWVESAFSVALSGNVDLTAHKLLPGQRIRLHNDFLPGQESHRIVVQLNRGWTFEDGGVLMLFDGMEPESVKSIISPIHNSAFTFAISPNSNHAVSKINRGERYTLVYSFYAE